MSDPDLLQPSVDPKVKKIGIRKVNARNEASTRTVTKIRDSPSSRTKPAAPTPDRHPWRAYWRPLPVVRESSSTGWRKP